MLARAFSCGPMRSVTCAVRARKGGAPRALAAGAARGPLPRVSARGPLPVGRCRRFRGQRAGFLAGTTLGLLRGGRYARTTNGRIGRRSRKVSQPSERRSTYRSAPRSAVLGGCGCLRVPSEWIPRVGGRPWLGRRCGAHRPGCGPLRGGNALVTGCSSRLLRRQLDSSERAGAGRLLSVQG